MLQRGISVREMMSDLADRELGLNTTGKVGIFDDDEIERSHPPRCMLATDDEGTS